MSQLLKSPLTRSIVHEGPPEGTTIASSLCLRTVASMPLLRAYSKFRARARDISYRAGGSLPGGDHVLLAEIRHNLVLVFFIELDHILHGMDKRTLRKSL